MADSIESARSIGRIARVQVQAESLKVAGTHFRRYDPAGLREMAALVLEPGGVVGLAGDGTRVEDVHHAGHPVGKHRGSNGVSVGFTSHYVAMRDRFPHALPPGEAGENILIETTHAWRAEELAGGVAIETVENGWATLENIIVAEPCVEFARHALRYPEDARPDRRVTDALRDLGQGVRGFYATYHGEPVRIAPGARVALLAE
ncbi:MAG: hypothetical protein IT337_06470 [Thermomicrobiales bacterium]|nr:hypothetical protein [Thermomicrobiales bacterium]